MKMKWQRRAMAAAGRQQEHWATRSAEPNAWEITPTVPKYEVAGQKRLAMIVKKFGLSAQGQRELLEKDEQRRKVVAEIRKAANKELLEMLERKKAAEAERQRRIEERAQQLEADRARREEERRIRSESEAVQMTEMKDRIASDAAERDPEEQARMEALDASDRDRKKELREEYRRSIEARARGQRAAAKAAKEERQTLTSATVDDWRASKDEVTYAEELEPSVAPIPTTTISQVLNLSSEQDDLFTIKKPAEASAPTLVAEPEPTWGDVSYSTAADELDHMPTVEFTSLDIDESPMTVPKGETKLPPNLAKANPKARRTGVNRYKGLPGSNLEKEHTYSQWMAIFDPDKDDIVRVLKSDGFPHGIACLSQLFEEGKVLKDGQRAILIEHVVNMLRAKRPPPPGFRQARGSLKESLVSHVTATFVKQPPGSASLEQLFNLVAVLELSENAKNLWDKYCEGDVTPAVQLSAIRALLAVPKPKSDRKSLHLKRPINNRQQECVKLAHNIFCLRHDDMHTNTVDMDVLSETASPGMRESLRITNEAAAALMHGHIGVQEYDQVDQLWERMKGTAMPAVKKAYLRRLTKDKNSKIQDAIALARTLQPREIAESDHRTIFIACTRLGAAEEAEAYCKTMPEADNINNRIYTLAELILTYAHHAFNQNDKSPEEKVEHYCAGMDSVMKRIMDLRDTGKVEFLPGIGEAFRKCVFGLTKLYVGFPVFPREPSTESIERWEAAVTANRMLLERSDDIAAAAGYTELSQDVPQFTVVALALMKLYVLAMDQNRGNAIVRRIDRAKFPPHITSLLNRNLLLIRAAEQTRGRYIATQKLRDI